MLKRPLPLRFILKGRVTPDRVIVPALLVALVLAPAVELMRFAAHAQNQQSALPTVAKKRAEFVPGELLVRFRPSETVAKTKGTTQLSMVQAAEMSSLASGLSMEINQLDERGVRVSSVVGGIELGLSDNLNAQFSASSIIGCVVSDIPTVKLLTDSQSDVQARIGSGGPRISISSVRGGIRLRQLD